MVPVVEARTEEIVHPSIGDDEGLLTHLLDCNHTRQESPTRAADIPAWLEDEPGPPPHDEWEGHLSERRGAGGPPPPIGDPIPSPDLAVLQLPPPLGHPRNESAG